MITIRICMSLHANDLWFSNQKKRKLELWINIYTGEYGTIRKNVKNYNKNYLQLQSIK